MKMKTLLACLILALVFWAIAWKTLPVPDVRPTSEPVKNIEAIDRIKIRDAKDSIVLERVDSQWLIRGEIAYPADLLKVSRLLLELKNIAILHQYPAGDNLAVYQLLDPAEAKKNQGIKIELQQGDKLLFQAIVGQKRVINKDDAVYEAGRYIYLPTSQKLAEVKQAFNSLNASETYWKDQTFPKVKTAKRIEVFNDEESLWKLTRGSKTGSLIVAGDIGTASFNTEHIERVQNAFAYASFISLIPKDSPQAPLLNSRRVEIEDFNGFVYSMQLGRIGEDGNMPLAVSVSFNPPEGMDPALKANLQQRHNYETKLYADWIYFITPSLSLPLSWPRYKFLKGGSDDDPLPKEKDDFEEEGPGKAPGDDGFEEE